MTESFDIYSDAFTVTTTPWGANLSFQLHEAHPVPSRVTPAQTLGTIRMSNEHLKVMAFIIIRQVRLHEERERVQFEVSTAVLSQMGIAREDWDALWGPRGG